jgi:hypothetical protein
MEPPLIVDGMVTPAQEPGHRTDMSAILARIPKLGQSEIDGTVLNPDQLRLKWEIKQTEEGQNSAGTN